MSMPRPMDVLRFLVRSTKRIVVTVVGGAFVAGGIAMLVLPGPGLLLGQGPPRPTAPEPPAPAVPAAGARPYSCNHARQAPSDTSGAQNFAPGLPKRCAHICPPWQIMAQTRTNAVSAY